MFRLRFVGSVILLVMLVSALPVAPRTPPVVYAQRCEQMENALNTAQANCPIVWENGACYGNPDLFPSFRQGVTNTFFNQQVRHRVIEEFSSINTSGAGIAVMALRPAGASSYVRFTMFGGATTGLGTAPDAITLSPGGGNYCADMPAVIVATTPSGQTSQFTVNGVLVELQSTAVITRGSKLLSGAVGASGQMVFASNRDGNWEIYTMDVNSLNPTRLTANGVFDYGPRFSPNGAQIAYQSGPVVDASGTDPGTELYVMNRDGSNPRRLTSNAVGDGLPSWSPDGTRIAFTSMRDGNQELYVMNVNDLSVSRLTNNPAIDTWPTWSSDGSQIAFFRQSGGQSHIYIMNANGTNERQLTFGGAYDRAPSWSPDGTRIAFVSTRDDPAGFWHVYVVDVAGGTPYRVTQQNSWAPSWTPDGQIVHMSNRDGDQELFLVNADGSNERRLTNNQTHDEHPNMAPGQQAVMADALTVTNKRGTVFVTASGQRQQIPQGQAIDIDLSSGQQPRLIPQTYGSPMMQYSLIDTAERVLNAVNLTAVPSVD